MSARRVVITGIGVISSIGIGRIAFAHALRSGKYKVGPIVSFNTDGYPYAHASEIEDLGELTGGFESLARTLGRSSVLAVLAAREAVSDAALDTTDLTNGGVVLGTADGESQVIDKIIRTWLKNGASQVDVHCWHSAVTHRISSAVADDLGLQGESMMIATACAAGNSALGYASDVVADGEADIMLCGGVDSLSRKTYSGFFRLGAITPDVCRPFDSDRRGLLTGEGAAILVLESLEHAVARKATIYAEVLGYGTNCDAHSMVAPQPEGVADCIRTAHRNAGIRPDQVDYISAHGTGTLTNDLVEVGAIREVFGDNPPPVSSIKSMIGHTMGAACAMSAVACVIGMHYGFLPPTMNFRRRDEGCRIDFVPNHARQARISIAESHGFGFGGNNAVLILESGRDCAPDGAGAHA